MPAPFERARADGIELRLKVVPGASRSRIVGVLGDRLKIAVSAPAEAGKANAAVIALLRNWLGVKTVTIASGHAAAEKTAHVAGLHALSAAQLATIGG